MTSFSLNSAKTTLAYPSAPSAISPIPRPLRKPWSYGRGYLVIALLAPVVLGSLLLVYLYNATKTRLSLWRLWR